MNAYGVTFSGIKRGYYANCKIQNIKKGNGFPRLSFDIVDADGKAHEILIQNSNTTQQLEELVTRKRERAILAFGMTDIDVWINREGVFCIEWSPCDGVYYVYDVQKAEIMKLLEAGKESA